MSILRRVMMPPPINTSSSTIINHTEYYDNDARPQNSPILAIRHVNLKPSPSPPPNFPTTTSSSATTSSSTSPEPGHQRKISTQRQPNQISQGDQVLISFLDGGRRPDIARNAAQFPLAFDDDDDEMEVQPRGEVVNLNPTRHASTHPDPDLSTLALDALEAVRVAASNATAEDAPIVNGHAAKDAAETKNSSNGANGTATGAEIPIKQEDEASSDRASGRDYIVDRKMSIKSLPDVSGKRCDPIQLPSPQHEELAPMQEQSPEAEKINNHVTLPSISAQLGDLTHTKIENVAAHRQSFSGSPPRPPLFMQKSAVGSPPVSPANEFRALPSPFSTSANSIRRPSQASEAPYSISSAEYSGTTETPNMDPSPPAQVFDRMSIDGITNPQVGGFRCNYTGCSAAPFQTQYLLNSHANVHSQVRPHYCIVKGCSRSEGGKGFKRKNEMIRHGLVHASPGYVCPFCPDRDHKYPRPDNLQRHVRVHHVDKDKDDAQLREVLSQRPEGPNRGRRRRGGTS